MRTAAAIDSTIVVILEEASEELEKSVRLVHDRLTRLVKREMHHR